MALFSKNTKKPATKKASKKAVKVASPEKALAHTRLEKGIYVFAVPPEATKTEVALAVERIYKVVPVKVNIANLPGKMKPMRAKRGRGQRARRHKAYVFLKKGDSIQF